MQCQYCDSFITPYPEDGICPNCGAKLPPDNTPKWQPHVTVVTPPPVYYQPPQYQPQMQYAPRCSRCGSADVTVANRHFRWGLAILGLFLLPPFGILLGLAGKHRQFITCRSCGHCRKL